MCVCVCGVDDVDETAEIEAEMGELGSRNTKKIAGPRLPTQAEADEHNKTICRSGTGAPYA